MITCMPHSQYLLSQIQFVNDGVDFVMIDGATAASNPA